MKIRKMMECDYPTVDKMMNDLHLLHVKGCPEFHKDTEHIYNEQAYIELLQNNKNICLIAEEKNIVVGFCFASIKQIQNACMIEQQIGYIESLYVIPECRKNGFGKELLQYVEKTLAGLDIKYLNLVVWDFNKKAIEFYENMRFVSQRHMYTKKI